MKTIAPCGINCKLCSAYRRERNRCPGCLDAKGNDNLKHLSSCSIKFCSEKKGGKKAFCFSCGKFPCAKIKHLDERYAAKYHLSVIENLRFIKEHGVRAFEKEQNEKWTCPKCKKDLICCHSNSCFGCGFEKTIWTDSEK